MHSNWLKRSAVAGFLIVGLLFATGAGAAAPDSWITTKAKLALLTTSGVSSTDVNVDTIDGHVTLHGTVSSAEEKSRAEQAVRGIDGVKDVRDMLAVVAPAKQEAVEVADKDIKQHIEQTLAKDPVLADSKITVASVNAGNVVLSGTAATLTDHLTAVEDARSVRGVRKVASEITSPDSLSDAEIWRDTKGTGKEAANTTTGVVTDMWITTAAKVRLLANEQTPATEINVDTRKGVVTLFGMVPTDAARRAAEAEVKKVSGVQSVHNELQVVAPSVKEAVKANDSELQDRIAKKVDAALTDNSDVSVEVKNGVVRLTGKVERQTDRISALTIARSTEGVRSVVDDLQVAVQ
jgi:hyperosmotically inducible protein